MEDTSSAFMATRLQLRLENEINGVRALDHVSSFFEFARGLIIHSEAASKAIRGRSGISKVEFTRLMAYASKRPYSIELMLDKSR